MATSPTPAPQPRIVNIAPSRLRGSLDIEQVNVERVNENALLVPGIQANVVPRNALGLDYVQKIWQPRGGERRLSLAYAPTVRLQPAALQALLPYQKEGITAAIRSQGFHLHWAPGAGKTLGALVWALCSPGGRVLFLTRAATLGTIAAEVARWTRVQSQLCRGQNPRLKRVRVPGKRRKDGSFRQKWGTVEVDPAEVFEPDATVLICSYEVLPFWIDSFENIAPFSAVVFDEVHRVKGRKRTDRRIGPDGRPFYVPLKNQAASAARASLLAARRLATTASPIRNRPSDLWAQLDLVEPGCWGDNWTYVHRYCDAQPSRWGGLDTNGSSNEDELRARLATVSHVVPYSVTHAELPAKRREVVRLEEDDLGAVPAGLKAHDLPGGIHGDICLASYRKRDWVVERAVEALQNGQKVVIFTGLRIDAELTGDALGRAAKGARGVVAHGGSSPAERDAVRLEYMAATGARAIVGTGDAWGESVNLQDTDLAIFASLPFTPGQLAQWEGRFSRHGQQRPVLICYPIAPGTIDEHVGRLMLDKLAPFDTLVANEALLGASDALRGPVPTDKEMQDQLAALVAAGGELE